jgi:hypothetical protein
MRHPALKNFSSTWEAVKIVGSKALKWAAVGAVALGGLALIPAAPLGILSSVVTFLTGAESSMGMATIVAGLIKGATIGGILGAVKGVGGVSKALEDRKQDVIADYEQANVANERAQLMARAPSQAVGSQISYNNNHVSKLEKQRQQQQQAMERPSM